MNQVKKALGKISIKKLPKKTLIIIAVSAAILAILIAVYVSLGMYFKNHFWFRTVINGVNCSGKTVAEVENLITEEISGYRLELIGLEDEKEVITGLDIDLKPVFDGSLKKALKSRNAFAWPASLFKKTTMELETMVTYAEEKLQSTIEGLDCLNESNSKKAENAHISGYIKGEGFKIIPEEEGTEIDAAVLKETLHTGIINLQKKISLKEAGCYLEPEIRSDSEELLAALDAANACLDAVITYQIGDKKEVLDSSVFEEWLSVTEDNQVAVDPELAGAFVQELASKYNTYGKARSFKTTYGPIVTLSRNEYGWRINQTGEVEQLTADIKAGTEVSREPVYSRRAKSYGADDHGGTYVEINITAQHMYFYKNGQLILENDIISGNLSKGWGTPSGAYSVTYTMGGKTLRGADYAVWVDYWMPFNGGIGLHDCTWHSEFGGDIYKTSGSHGCINMPPAAAKTLYQHLRKGDAVIVYELAGTESDKAKASPVITLINSIGTVTLNSASAIQAARVGYDGLSESVKAYVTNYETLVNAESAYQALLDEKQAKADAEAADAVMKAIEAIGEVTAETKETAEKAINAARNQYDKLSKEAKTLVKNYSVLEAAEAELKKLSEAGNI